MSIVNQGLCSIAVNQKDKAPDLKIAGSKGISNSPNSKR